ncbi:aminotransferase class V-fold PLP-dependent enzyme [Allomeiothermus silvanus]|uniref:aminotransferase class V-fold PLP-dependent enzyme n=1 Tax=Allomeiothermus silvanus TaxID=52022 RepID=UPI0023F4AA2E|nr:aminotransferase class V-fold PLP-dependent enzyme [Allomeiothermus silvanus]
MNRFGRKMLEHFPLEPQAVYLNHGTVGVTPRRVLEAQQAIRDEIERHPARYLLRELSGLTASSGLSQPRLRSAAQEVAEFLGARGEDLVFVGNATTGVNAVLRSLGLEPGDEILIANLAYGAVTNAAAFVARERGAKVVRLELPFPLADPGLYVEAVDQALTPRTKVAILDHITSETALILPLAEMAERARAKGVLVLADGAHAPGQIPLEIPALGVDWYVANLHKWAFAPRGCGILWAAPERQKGLHPPVISWGLDQGFTQEFDWVGTQDPSAYLAAPEGIRFMRDLGVEAMRQYNHDLAGGAAQMLMERWNLELPTPQSMIGSMVTLPLPQGLGSSPADAARLKDALLFEDHIEVPVMAIGGRLWARISAQIYNDLSDIERFAQALERRL